MKKISIDNTMDEIVSIQNQLNGLQLLLNQKKALMARYFDKTGERSISNSDCSVFVQERTHIEYDIPALKEKLSKQLFNYFVETECAITETKAFTTFLKDHGISPKEIRPYLSIRQTVNQEKLAKLYEQNKLTLADIASCYTATVKKSIVLKLKNANQEIPIAKTKQ